MPLLMGFRRYWAIVMVMVLALPTIGLFTPDLPAPPNGIRAPAKHWWLHATERLDPFINTVFGFRGLILMAHARYGRWAGNANANVLIGNNGALFIRADQAVEQSLGLIVRRDRIAAAADTAQALDVWMKAHGGRFLMAPPPNAHTVNFDLLPLAVRLARKDRTETDLLAQLLHARGVAFVDLRPILAAANADGPTYRWLDTHWNHRGAVLAFNAAMDGLGRPDLRVDPKEVLGPPQELWTGDLLPMLGLTRAAAPDINYPLGLPAGAPTVLTPLPGIVTPPLANDAFLPYAFDTGRPGPRIMVIGDSFTYDLWRPLLAARSSAFAWIHHHQCHFNRDDVERFKPDLLILAPTERLFPCTQTGR